MQHDGFIEYQYRVNTGEIMPTDTQQLVTWRGNLSTYAWRPWLLQLDASIGLTRTTASQSEIDRDGTLVTGGATASLFPRSHFPFRAFFESRDSRVEGVLADLELSTTTLGFLQQYAPRSGGSYALEYRQSDNDNVSLGGGRAPRSFSNEIWQLTAANTMGRNDFRLTAINRQVDRRVDLPNLQTTENRVFDESESRNIVSLRHRFRTSPRFFLEDTTFFADERIRFDGSDMHRRFLQFNGLTTWRPATERPLFVTLRALAQGIDSGPDGLENGSRSVIFNAAANYQLSRGVTIAANAGTSLLDPDTSDRKLSYFQRARSSYRSPILDLAGAEYVWGGTIETGNRRDSNGDDVDVQDAVATLNHSYTKLLSLPGYRQLQLSFAQQVSAAGDTIGREENTLNNSVFLTLDRQNGRTSSYFRLSLTDRRLFGDRDDVFQLANLQASRRTQVDRRKSWDGSITVQYSHNLRDDPFFGADNESVSYSADIGYSHQDLFNIRMLNFRSRLRLLSNDFQSDDPFDRRIGEVVDRDEVVWRNRLEYRIGRLELRLLADLREVSDQWMSRFFFQVRRYYGEA